MKTPPICTIEWNTLSLQDWQARFHKIRRSNLLQSYEYAQATCTLNRQKARWGLIKINGVEAGLVQILEAGLFNNFLHALIIDRGPLWFDQFNTAENFEAFCKTLNTHFPARLGRKRRFIPETKNSENAQKILTQQGFKPKFEQKYQTIWIDLSQNLQKLEVNLKKKWRNSLKKAKKSDISLKWDTKGTLLEKSIQEYATDKAIKGYDGPSTSLLRTLGHNFMPSGNLIIGQAMLNNKAIAGIIIFGHGTSATYQIGYTSDLGRKHNAHHLLLWESLSILKERGFRDFDLGGFNDDTAKNVKAFKEGMGGHIVYGPGIFS